MNNLIATVAVEKTFFSADSDFDYIIPVSLINNVKIGSMVKVPFGNGNKLRCAIVVNIYSAINYIEVLAFCSAIRDKVRHQAIAYSSRFVLDNQT